LVEGNSIPSTERMTDTHQDTIMRRFTRLTNAFSKKRENLEAAVSLHFAHYNFVQQHKSLRVTPAMTAGVSDRLWSSEELVNRASS
jgi:hypothetical protein